MEDLSAGLFSVGDYINASVVYLSAYWNYPKDQHMSSFSCCFCPLVLPCFFPFLLFYFTSVSLHLITVLSLCFCFITAQIHKYWFAQTQRKIQKQLFPVLKSNTLLKHSKKKIPSYVHMSTITLLLHASFIPAQEHTFNNV